MIRSKRYHNLCKQPSKPVAPRGSIPSWPEVVEHYVPIILPFEQHPGLIFTDPTNGITQGDLFPEDDELRDFARGWQWDVAGELVSKRETQDQWVFLDRKLQVPKRRPLDRTFYFELASSWFHHDMAEEDTSAEPVWVRQALWYLAVIHTRLQEHSNRVPSPLRSLRRLEDGVNQVLSQFNAQSDESETLHPDVLPEDPVDAATLLGTWYWSAQSFNIPIISEHFSATEEACVALADAVSSAEKRVLWDPADRGHR